MTPFVSIGELFTKEQRKVLHGVLKKSNGTASDFLPTLRGWKADLEAKEALPEYIAYALEHLVKTHGKDAILGELK